MKEFSKAVKVWLIAGCILLFFQVVIGGITRITGSGLSITKWEIVTGTFPPSSSKAWNEEFSLYKATPQYEKINEGMSLSEFKFIYFWEYFHRLWARMMGFIFLFPFIFFVVKGYFDKKLLKLLSAVFLLAVMAASMGWIMVASGLLSRPWVNAYKLALHLSVALACYGVLVWTTYYAFDPKPDKSRQIVQSGNLIRNFVILLCIQIFIGGVMSGMKAGLLYPTWPDMNGELIPNVLLKTEFWNLQSFNLYDKFPLLPALIQFIHRGLAYLLTGFGLALFIRLNRQAKLKYEKRAIYLFITLLVSQVVLGILTIINCVGRIPLFLGVSHQAVAMLLLSSSLYLLYISRK